jgi:hypothetical protein
MYSIVGTLSPLSDATASPWAAQGAAGHGRLKTGAERLQQHGINGYTFKLFRHEIAHVQSNSQCKL